MSNYSGRYLRTNYRVTGKEIDADAIGGGAAQGSWGQAGGVKRWFGGYIMGSFNGVYSGGQATGIGISAAGAIASYFGSAPGWSDIEGYKIMPVNIQDASVTVGLTAVSHVFEYMWSISGSIFFVWGYKLQVATKNVEGGGAGEKISVYDIASLASAESVHFVWAGFIISGP